MSALQGDLAANGVDVAIFDEIEAVQWLTGFSGALNLWRACVVPAKGRPFFVIRALDAGPFRQASWMDDVETFRDWDDCAQVLAHALAKRGIATACVGHDPDSYAMPVRLFRQVCDALPVARFVDVGALVTDRRMIKTPDEIELLRRSARIADAGVARIRSMVETGVTLREVLRTAYDVYLAEGADPAPVGPITVGAGEDFLHGHLRAEPLRDGEICHIELLPKLSGYASRIMRPIAVGTASRRQAEVARAIIELQDAQFAAMRPGAVARDVDAIVRDAVVERGLRADFSGISGYTVGFNGPASPRTSDFNRIFHPKAEWRLQAGMTFHMYLAADGIAFSETILVTDTGAQRLTQSPRHLAESALAAA